MTGKVNTADTPATHWGTHTWGDAPPTPPNPSPKDTLHRGVPNTAAPDNQMGLPHATTGHADAPHLQQHMTHVRTVRAITASQVRHDPLTFHLPHNKSQPEPEQA